MANKLLITTAAKSVQVEQMYFSPVAVVPPFTQFPLTTVYCFLARVDPWTDDNNPPMPTEDMRSIKQYFKNIFAVRHVTSNDISPVIQRIDWQSGTVYDYYDDTVNMFEKDSNGFLLKHFYIKNRFDQVFKCLWNAGTDVYGAPIPSTVEPYFQPGVYNTNNVFQGADDYKWKYMYTIDSGTKLKFMDTSWIPVRVGDNTPNPLSEYTTAGAGSIDVINITDGGQLYDPANAAITVTVIGDGTGATAAAVVPEGMNAITDINVINPGSGYTYANVSISSSAGFGAQAFAPTSPIGGHGFDPLSELGCSNVMFSVEFNGSEGGIIPTDITYHQVGILAQPTTKSLSADSQYGYIPTSGDIYKVYSEYTVAPGFGTFSNDEIIYQGDSANPSFFATVLSFDPASNIIRVLNMTGTPTLNAPIKGRTTNTTRTLLQYTDPDFQIFSGYLSYIENRTSVQRSSDGIEQYKFVLSY